jgi:hypothetical protein
MIRIAITAAAYAAIRESLPPAKSCRYAPRKAVGGPNTLVERGIDGAALARQRRYAAYLYRRRLELLAPNFNPLAAAMVA